MDARIQIYRLVFFLAIGLTCSVALAQSSQKEEVSDGAFIPSAPETPAFMPPIPPVPPIPNLSAIGEMIALAKHNWNLESGNYFVKITDNKVIIRSGNIRISHRKFIRLRHKVRRLRNHKRKLRRKARFLNRKISVLERRIRLPRRPRQIGL